ncbi:methylmalonyl-CoA epimerase [candidate division KSB3 bacterium]|uniref:Methylmalonyl-CoA epimerase n=1 Tax=candidate division KSB3 bacterium TaxID=2044937 RepID=A0A9D5Q660_9BACT|nr:methylmalonyl-CoA epimerase [candidate division KSB3 bacterium]MBD3324942.1 methylmalonyl-CoA epimerase [candidate division KSB3 bacterium]
MYTKVDHIGIAVKNIEQSLGIYRDLLGLELEGQQTVESQNVVTAFFPVGETHIELVQPTEGNTGVMKFLEKRGEGVHHICFEVDDIDQALKELERRGARLIDTEPRTIEGGAKKIAFLHPKSTGGVLIELSQRCA